MTILLHWQTDVAPGQVYVVLANDTTLYMGSCWTQARKTYAQETNEWLETPTGDGAALLDVLTQIDHRIAIEHTRKEPP